MEHLRINASKLKISLSAEECKRYGIRETEGEYDPLPVREVISDILKDAGLGGFYKLGEKLLVQLYPNGRGGAELFITKLSSVAERERRALAEAELLDTYSKERVAFVFEDVEALIDLCRILAKRDKRADLYLSHSGKYLLLLEEEHILGISDCDIATEFGERLSSTGYLPSPEWDKLLIKDDAIAKLALMKRGA